MDAKEFLKSKGISKPTYEGVRLVNISMNAIKIVEIMEAYHKAKVKNMGAGIIKITDELVKDSKTKLSSIHGKGGYIIGNKEGEGTYTSIGDPIEGDPTHYYQWQVSIKTPEGITWKDIKGLTSPNYPVMEKHIGKCVRRIKRRLDDFK